MIVVTGASKGLGKAICERLRTRQVDILGLARDVSALEFPSLSCDVSQPEQVKAAASEVRARKIKVSGLINAAGIASMNLALTTPPQVSERIIATNLLGTIYCCQMFAPLLIRNKGGVIVNFSTIAVALGLQGESIYIASKAGVEAFTRSFAREVGSFNINVNCIAPGPIATELLKGVTDAQIEHIVSRQILQRRFTPEAVCDLVEILFDERSKSLSGQLLHVGGA